MAKWLDSIQNALQTDVGQQVSGGALGAVQDWLSPDDEDPNGSGGGSITDEPWFIPVVVIVVLGGLYVATKRD